MLLAELHSKLKGRFACGACGNEDATDFGALAASEDALTSTVFGLLRYTDPRLALGPILARCGLEVGAAEAWKLQPWPRHAVRLRKLREHDLRQVSCEPDMVIEGPTGVVVMEAKLGAPLGGDPMQLPQEALVAHRISHGNPWRLLCVTTHRNAPTLPGFRVSGSLIEPGEYMPLNEAVASYFEAVSSIGIPGEWPAPDRVRASITWLSWGAIATLIEAALAAHPTVTSHDTAQANDVLDLLRSRSLYEEPFRGFRNVPKAMLGARVPEVWAQSRIAPRFRWTYPSTALVWPHLNWLVQPSSTIQHSPMFSTLIHKTLSWPLGRWLSTSSTKV